MLIEAKLWADKSGIGDRDQLVRYLSILEHLDAVDAGIPRDAERFLLYLTPRESLEEVEASAALTRADPAERNPQRQFYIAYSFYRQGWGRLYHDDALYRQGLQVLDRAVGLLDEQGRADRHSQYHEIGD